MPFAQRHCDSLARVRASSGVPGEGSAGATGTRGETRDTFASAIYEGSVRHRRHSPHAHAFTYRMAMLYVDIGELDYLFAGSRLWSINRPNIAELRRSDYFGDPSGPLDDAVRDRVEAACGLRPLGPIRMLTHLRYFGYIFNPVTFYYCFARDGVTLVAVLAEITNTPWRERHAYVLPVAGATPRGSVLSWNFNKTFHVSPFLPMHCRYDWRFTVPGDALRVNMDVFDTESSTAKRQFDATLVLRRRPLNATNLARVLMRFPLMTAKIVAAIHWQALRVWARGNPIFDHPPPDSSLGIGQGKPHDR